MVVSIDATIEVLRNGEGSRAPEGVEGRRAIASGERENAIPMSETTRKEGPVRRLTFAYRDGSIELVSEQRVDMRMPARTTHPEPRAGFWYELRDPRAEVLFRLDAEDPIPTDVEVFSDDPDQSVARAPHAPEEGVFTVILPDVEDAAEVRLMRAAARPGAPAAEVEALAEGPVEVGRFRLTKEAR